MIISRAELGDVRTKVSDASIALRFGCFDLLHEGHRKALDFAASQADVLVVGVLPDAMVRRQKGPNRPNFPENSRVAVMDQSPLVDYSFITPNRALLFPKVFRALRPDIYVEHIEYETDLFKKAFLKMMGIELVVDENEKLDSTSSMIERLGLDEAIESSGRTIKARIVPQAG
jgi:cytidyltransferase-like protein